MKYKIKYGDILQLDEEVDAIVNSANPFMSCGGGICGAIHRAAGYEFTEYSIKLGGLKVGECKITPGFKLKYDYVLHVLSPHYKKTTEPKEDLIRAYHNVFRLAEEHKLKTVALPLLGGDHHRYPYDLALKWAKEAMEKYESEELEVQLILKQKAKITSCTVVLVYGKFSCNFYRVLEEKFGTCLFIDVTGDYRDILALYADVVLMNVDEMEEYEINFIRDFEITINDERTIYYYMSLGSMETNYNGWNRHEF